MEGQERAVVQPVLQRGDGSHLGRGEPAVEAHGGRTASGQARIAGGGCKQMVSPQLRREAVVVMRWEVAVSERRACGLIEIYRRTYRATARGPATAGAVARAGRRAAKVRISPIDAKVGAGRMEGESQAPVPAVRRRKAGPSPEAGPMPTRRIAAGVAAEADSSRSLDPVNTHSECVDQIEALGVLGQDRRKRARCSVAKAQVERSSGASFSSLCRFKGDPLSSHRG